MNMPFEVPEIPGVTTADNHMGTSEVPSSSSSANWLACLSQSIHRARDLAKLDVPERERIVGDWFKESDLGFIFGPRGLGKTWHALHFARACAEGRNVAEWKTSRAWPVLYIDGEMSLDSIRERDAALAGDAGSDAPLFYLQHEALFYQTGEVMNLTLPHVQAALLEHCKQYGIKIVFLDNLSCLFSGMKENDADAWQMVLPWLLEMRRNRIAVVFIAHAGRNGNMRGTSRREDAAVWIIQLSEAKDASMAENGARFVARFTKNRNSTENECPPVEWHFHFSPGEAKADVKWRKLSTVQVFRQWIEDGLTSATEIAEEMGISKGQVSKLATRGIGEGWLKKVGREYALVMPS